MGRTNVIKGRLSRFQLQYLITVRSTLYILQYRMTGTPKEANSQSPQKKHTRPGNPSVLGNGLSLILSGSLVPQGPGVPPHLLGPLGFLVLGSNPLSAQLPPVPRPYGL